jgi:hypothetical protein
MASLGGRKPLELLACMLKLCPQGDKMSSFFTHLFLGRLPPELRVTLWEDDYQNVRALTKKTDALWSLHEMKTSFSVSLVSLVAMEEPYQVAAISNSGSTCSSGGRSGGGQPFWFWQE